jgi:hypothetical protein
MSLTPLPGCIAFAAVRTTRSEYDPHGASTASRASGRGARSFENPQSSPDQVPNHGVRASKANKIPANCARATATDKLMQSSRLDRAGRDDRLFLGPRVCRGPPGPASGWKQTTTWGRGRRGSMMSLLANVGLQLSARHCIRGAGSTINHRIPSTRLWGTAGPFCKNPNA